MDPFVGEIRMLAGMFVPLGWLLCDGRLVSIKEYSLLFAVIGFHYGGDGSTTMGLPDLRGRAPISAGHLAVGGGTVYNMGDSGGHQDVSLEPAQLPPHTHLLLGSTATAEQSLPTDRAILGSNVKMYARKEPRDALHKHTIRSSGNGQPFDNRKPYSVVNYIIAHKGVFPSRG
ncbi:MAG TPA: tail fiber protein [Candidatus Baltobacteraceae bacterium]|nr:tail fiber protein [Candidatus Baltobacteraceae bacterium]